MSMLRHHPHTVPELNTSSLPDLIFSVLFFFMIVTHMRSDLLKVRYQVPQGTELSKLTHKSTVTNIYIGRSVDKKEGKGTSDAWQIQVNDKLVTTDELAAFLKKESSHAAAADKQNLSANISADKGVPMGLVTDVKQALRLSGILKVNYTGTNCED